MKPDCSVFVLLIAGVAIIWGSYLSGQLYKEKNAAHTLIVPAVTDKIPPMWVVSSEVFATAEFDENGNVILQWYRVRDGKWVVFNQKVIATSDDVKAF